MALKILFRIPITYDHLFNSKLHIYIYRDRQTNRFIFVLVLEIIL